MNPEERFWAKVNKTPTCWLWTAGTRGSSTRPKDAPYGVFGVKAGHVVRAHRYAYELANGSIPAGLWVCHTCDTPLCVRPDHLFLGNAQTNVDDCKAKGRLRVGLRHQNAKLTDEQVHEIKTTPFVRGIVTSFAKRFGIAKSTVSQIRHGTRRKAA